MAQQVKNLADLSIDDLAAELSSLQGEYQTMRFDHAVKGLANPMELRSMRREIARINTELRSRELAQMTPEQLELRSKMRLRRRRQR